MLRDDLETQMMRLRGHQVPDGSGLPAGYVLTIVNQSPFAYDWRQQKDDEIIRGHGDPNGARVAPKGFLYEEVDEPGVWQNTDGLSTWTQLGTSGTGADPNSFDYLEAQDDGTNTGLATDIEVKFGFTDAGPPGTSGTDISINGSNELIANIDGIYSFACGVHMQSEVNSDTFDFVHARIHMERSVRGDVDLRDYRSPLVISGPKHYAQMTLAWTGFMTAGDEFAVYGEMQNGGASTWTGDAWAYIQRIV